jgi:uncharacterized membrane protein YgcG
MTLCSTASNTLLLTLALLSGVRAAPALSALSASIDGFEAEHLSLVEPAGGAGHWTPPVLDAAAAGHLFAWRATAAHPSRNVTQVCAVLTLTAVDQPGSIPLVCRSDGPVRQLLCGGGLATATTEAAVAAPVAAPASRFAATLNVTLANAHGATTTASARGWFLRGLGASAAGWGGAEWIGVAGGANDTASQFRANASLGARQGFRSSRDVARAVLFVSGLGGYRASVNGRALDPTAVRASVTEWHNRTFYFAHEVTSDVAAALAAGTAAASGGGSGGGGSVVIAVELFKHWYGLSNNFYPTPYGPRALKAVLAVTHANGTTVFAAPTLPGPQSRWRQHSGALLFDDLHAGQRVDGRQATADWETAVYAPAPPHAGAAAAAWAAPNSVQGPPGALRPHPMPRSRVLERVLPVNVSAIAPSAIAPPGGATYRAVLPYEVAGFCTLLLPPGCTAGTTVQVRHGECVDPKTNELCPVEAPHITDSAMDTYTCRGNATGMGAHDVSWRRLALSGNASDDANDQPEREAFTPAFTYSAFKYLDLTYYDAPPSEAGAAATGGGGGGGGSSRLAGRPGPPALDLPLLSCLRIGTGFDHTGDVVVAGPVITSGAGGALRGAGGGALLAAVAPLPPDRCGRVQEHRNLILGCPDGQTIDQVLFASFGSTAGNCSAGFHAGMCPTTGEIGSASRSVAVAQAACLGQSSCVIPATQGTFDIPGHGDPCPHFPKTLAVEARCSGEAPGSSCAQSCYDDEHPHPSPGPTPPGPPSPGPPPSPPSPGPPPSPPSPGPPPSPPPPATTTPAQRFNAVVAAARSTAIANYVMDIPTDSPQEEKRGWCGDSLATHRTYAAFFDMRAAWIKWTEDQAFTSSMLQPVGTMTSTVPCIFAGLCRNDPRGQGKMTTILSGLAWGSILPQLSAFTAALTSDSRYAGRVAGAAARYVGLVGSFANNDSYPFPELLNITSAADGYNVGQQGWPASAYGDWCPANKAGGSACTSVSTLLNSVYFILDLDGALSLARAAAAGGSGGSSGDGSGGGSGGGGGGGGGGSGGGGENAAAAPKQQVGTPSEAQMAQWLAQARASFPAAFLHQISVQPLGQAPGGNASKIEGLAYRDLYPANITHHGNANTPPSAQAEAAAGMAAMDSALAAVSRNNTDIIDRGALGEMLAGLVLNASAVYSALQVGGVLDMAQLGRSLVSYGRPDAAFALLSTDGPTSLYHMAQSTGTLWAHPGGADGNRGKCSSHNHIMQGGSVGEAVFGIGGIRPAFLRGAVPGGGGGGPRGDVEQQQQQQQQQQLRLAPVPWLPEAPLGAAVWRTLAGTASTSWAARHRPSDVDAAGDAVGDADEDWGVWVNATVPVGAGTADVAVALPRSAQATAVCAWECALAGGGGPAASADAFEAQWVSFDGGDSGFSALRAVAPPPAALTVPGDLTACTPLWQAGAAAKGIAAVGVASVVWEAIVPGRTMFPALAVGATSGSYAFFARPCSLTVKGS